jgi:hypothetical protein
MVARDVQMWAVIDRYDRILPGTVRQTKDMAIDASGLMNAEFDEPFACYRVARVTVSEVQDD